MHLYELLACLALISSAFVCVVVHVTQKGYPFWCYGDAFGSPFWLGVWTGPLCYAPCAADEGEGREGLAKCAPVAPTASKRRTRSAIPRETDLLEVGDWLMDKDTLCLLNQELLMC